MVPDGETPIPTSFNIDELINRKIKLITAPSTQIRFQCRLTAETSKESNVFAIIDPLLNKQTKQSS